MSNESIKLIKRKSNSVYIFLLVLVVVIWGIVPNISKYLLGHFSPAIKSSFSAVIAFIGIAVVALPKLKSLNKKYLTVGIPTGVFYSFACLLQQIGLAKTSPAMYAFLENLSCLVVPFLVWWLTKKRPMIFKFIAAILCLLSVYILGGAKLDGTFGIGDLLCGVAGIFYGVNIAVTGVKARGLDSSLYLFVQFGVHAIISTVYALVFEEIVFSSNPSYILLLIVITIVSTVIGWLIRTVCLTHLDPTFVSVVMPFSSVITTCISIAVGSDKISSYLIVGAIVGVAAAFISDFKPKRVNKS